MADLFGAPQGIIASNELTNQNTLSGLKAVEMLGAIAQQPTDLALKQAELGLRGAQTREYNALAEQKEQAALAQKRLLKIQERAQIAATNRKVNEQSILTTGLPLTADKLDPITGTVKVESQSAPLEQYVKDILDAGGTEQEVMPIRKEIAEIRQKEAMVLQETATAAQRKGVAAKEQRQALGAEASAILAMDERTYAQWKLDPRQQSELKATLPNDRRSAEAPLQYIKNKAIEADKKEELRQGDLRVKAAQSTAGAAQATSVARVNYLDVRKKDLELESAAKTKEGGKFHPDVIKAKNDAAAVAKALVQARLDAMHPQLPATEDSIVPNPKTGIYPTYQHKGMLYRVMGKNAAGKLIFADPTPIPKGVGGVGAAPAKAEPTDEELLATLGED